MSRIWILAGDSTRARVFFTDKRNGALTEQFDMVNPEGRLHEQDLTTDLPGTTANSATGMRHNYGADETRKPRAAEAFARDIAQRLEHARTKGEWDKLYIVAEPSFLGMLRKALDRDTAQQVAGEVDKSLARGSAADIRRVLPDFL